MNITDKIIAFALSCAAEHIDYEWFHKGSDCCPNTKAVELGDGWHGLQQSFGYYFPGAPAGSLDLFWRVFEYQAGAMCGRPVRPGPGNGY